jgi:hypothetical protein
MPVMDKLSMLQTLSLDGFLSTLLPSMGSDLDFDTTLAQLLTSIGHEFCETINTSSLSDDGRALAWTLLQKYLPLLLPFLNVQYDPDDDPSGNESGALASEVVPFITEYFAILKKEKKRDPSSIGSMREFLFKLLQGKYFNLL